MDALELLLNRHSTPRLMAPAPSDDDIRLILNAGGRVPDHGGLRPWEFVVISGEGLGRLGELFHQAAIADGMPAPQQARANSLPLRAPLIIVALAKVSHHPKVPAIEQIQSAGCGVMAMQQAAQALGYGGIWRTGTFARSDTVRRGFDLTGDDELVGFLYLGTPAGPTPALKTVPVTDKVRYWR